MSRNLNYAAAIGLLFVFIAQVSFAQTLYEMPAGTIESRVASGENPTGEKGKGGQANGGRKGSPTVPIKAGESRVLAEVKDSSGTVRRIWMTFWDRSPQMLRSLRIDMYWDGADRPAARGRRSSRHGLVCLGHGQLRRSAA